MAGEDDTVSDWVFIGGAVIPAEGIRGGIAGNTCGMAELVVVWVVGSRAVAATAELAGGGITNADGWRRIVGSPLPDVVGATILSAVLFGLGLGTSSVSFFSISSSERAETSGGGTWWRCCGRPCRDPTEHERYEPDVGVAVWAWEKRVCKETLTAEEETGVDGGASEKRSFLTMESSADPAAGVVEWWYPRPGAEATGVLV